MVSGTSSSNRYSTELNHPTGTTLKLTKKGSIEYINPRQGLKIISSNTGATSPYPEKEPVHIYTQLGKTVKYTHDTNITDIVFDAPSHIEAIHLQPEDMQPGTYREHTHTKATTQQKLFDNIALNQVERYIPKDLALFKELKTMIDEQKQAEPDQNTQEEATSNKRDVIIGSAIVVGIAAATIIFNRQKSEPTN